MAILSTLLTALLATTVIATPKPPTLPVVDLGYEIHRALSHDPKTDTYKFSNIRYAQPPTGNLRFRAPVPPLTNRDAIQSGEEVRSCPQGIPLWQARAVKPTSEYSNGREFSLQSWEADIKNYTPTTGKPPPPTTEDCLFLDVHVPRKVFDDANRSGGCDAPVLVWIHGGGYVLSSKNGWPTPGFEPSGLLQQAKSFNKKGIIFVALNYRLGALGFLPGSDVEKDGDLNAGLLDQRLALQWVQDNIHLFGGSRDRVTVMGESAGGGSILLHLLGKNYKAPFSQIIAQSPAFIPTFQAPKSAYAGFLDALNVTSLEEAREASPEAIVKANAAQIGAAPATTYIYGPVLDKNLVPDYPYAMFERGHFDKSVRVLASHTAFEGGFFFDVDNMTDVDFIPWIQRSIPGLSQSEEKYLADELYPPTFDGSLGYTDQGSRQMALWGEAVIDCNFAGMNRVVQGEGYAYQFNVTPGLHTQDLKYIFNDPQNPAFNPVAQDTLQGVITSFVVQGVPKLKNESYEFPRWGTNGNVVSINEADAAIGLTDVNQTRCDWWQTFRSRSN
ncbi:hypothetical protein NW768_010252 [Fusarium equiseti]|uniref:Carboxylic ester hydrolase n=1 Tax=Fusarium equiseti TaxID=61235 RepID=A0ABQ8R1I3_FUSEQ|nr:hypothetical protein NW768_010252 [Fusarium equiseti]